MNESIPSPSAEPDQEFQSAPRKRRERSNWITSYADMITLLLVFFIIVTASSKITASQFEKIQKMMSGEEAGEDSIAELVRDLSGIMKKHGIADYVQIIEEEDGVRMLINDNLLFGSGQADIERNNQTRFLPILGALRELPTFYTFAIEGHTDDVPINTAQFPSNWHLSTKRALSVLDLFLQQGFQETRLSLHGLASTQPLVPNRDAEGQPIPENQKRNRRVVLRVR
ncbi:MAG: OmpA family protein [Deltaproteobacteria bacterium]|nr:OmpA family protein [Deltaproteobacteria bacterium]